MASVHAFKGYLGAGKAASGTDLGFSAAARDRFCRFIDLELTEANQEELDPTSGRAEPEAAFLGPFDTRIRGTLEGTTEGLIGYLLRSLFGTVASAQQAATTAYLHTFTLADTLPSASRLTLEARYGTKAEAEVVNAVVKSMRYDFSNRGLLRWGFEALGALPTYTSTPTSATLAAAGTTHLSQQMHTFTLFGATRKIRSGSIEIDHGNDEDDFTATSRARQDAEYGALRATFDLEVLFADLADHRRFWGGATLTTPADVPSYYAVNVKAEHPTEIVGAAGHKYTAEFDFPKAFLTGVTKPMRGRDAIVQRIQGTAVYDSATTKAVDVKVKSTQTTN